MLRVYAYVASENQLTVAAKTKMARGAQNDICLLRLVTRLWAKATTNSTHVRPLLPVVLTDMPSHTNALVHQFQG